MAIISIPANISKGTSVDVTLDMSELLAEVSDAYFSVQANLEKVLITYSSIDATDPENNQKKLLSFDPSLENPICAIFFSSTARDLFVLKKIKLVDRDGGSFDIPLKNIEKAGFNIDFSAGGGGGEGGGGGGGLSPWINYAEVRINGLSGTQTTGVPNQVTGVPIDSNYFVNITSVNWVDIESVNFDNASITVIVDGVEISTTSWSSYNFNFAHASVAGLTKTIGLRLNLTGFESYIVRTDQFSFSA